MSDLHPALVRLSDVKRAKPRYHGQLWRHDERERVLVTTEDRCYEYEVDLDRCRTSAEVLDWILHVNGKKWATSELVGELVDAIDCILDPQASMCSFGIEGGLRRGVE